MFLYINKAHDALYYGRYLNILATYGVGPWALYILQRYWDRISMVYRASGYFGGPFKGQRGVTQGNRLPATIFNTLVDSILHHWVSVVTEAEGGDDRSNLEW